MLDPKIRERVIQLMTEIPAEHPWRRWIEAAAARGEFSEPAKFAAENYWPTKMMNIATDDDGRPEDDRLAGLMEAFSYEVSIDGVHDAAEYLVDIWRRYQELQTRQVVLPGVFWSLDDDCPASIYRQDDELVILRPNRNLPYAEVRLTAGVLLDLLDLFDPAYIEELRRIRGEE